MDTLHPPTARFSMPLYNENSFSLHCKAKCYTALFSMLYNENYNQHSFHYILHFSGCITSPQLHVLTCSSIIIPFHHILSYTLHYIASLNCCNEFIPVRWMLHYHTTPSAFCTKRISFHFYTNVEWSLQRPRFKICRDQQCSGVNVAKKILANCGNSIKVPM